MAFPPLLERKPVGAAFFDRPVQSVAMDLVGCDLTLGGVGGVIVETEAYAADDPASHSFNGPSPRNAVMFGPSGRAYVYRIYGLHWCLNFTCGSGSAVLIRAIEPVRGLDAMMLRRGVADPRALCSGPGKLCQALDVDGRLNGVSILAPPFEIVSGAASPVHVGPRIGISRGKDVPWRFSHGGSAFLSRRSAP